MTAAKPVRMKTYQEWELVKPDGSHLHVRETNRRRLEWYRQCFAKRCRIARVEVREVESKGRKVKR
jgi:hypothetical protein